MQQEYPVTPPEVDGKIRSKLTKRSRRLIIALCIAIAVAATVVTVLYLPKLVKEDKGKTSGRNNVKLRSNGSQIQTTTSSIPSEKSYTKVATDSKGTPATKKYFSAFIYPTSATKRITSTATVQETTTNLIKSTDTSYANVTAVRAARPRAPSVADVLSPTSADEHITSTATVPETTTSSLRPTDTIYTKMTAVSAARTGATAVADSKSPTLTAELITSTTTGPVHSSGVVSERKRATESTDLFHTPMSFKKTIEGTSAEASSTSTIIETAATNLATGPIPDFTFSSGAHTTAVPSSSMNRLSTATPNKDPATEWGWSSWNQWNGCSKTCDGGQQVRYRTCNVIQERVSSDLDTTNGSCVGKSQQVRECADWNCPDCNKTCKVGTLNAACDACECAHHFLTGRILTAEGRALSKANISLAETPYNVISQSNVSGHFRVFGVCASSQLFLVVRESFVPLRVLSKKQSATESKLDTKLENAVSPSVRVHPESKMRISGQSVVFCCNVEGNPIPEVEWFRNGNILSSDKHNYTNTIYIPNVSEMGGVYKCRAVNDFGAEYSEEAELIVVDSVKDSCNSTPTVHNMTLPPGCFHEETNSSVVNIGYCADSRCVRNDTNFTGDACSDRHYCCDSQKTSNVPVLCSGNVSFKLPTIQECGCTECRVKMAYIQGIVVGGVEESTMEHGDVIVEGLDNTFTNAEGRFLVAVPKDVRRVVMTFTDIFQKLESTTKVFRVDTKQSNFYKIHLRERAPVMEFSGTNLKDFPLSRGNEPSFADLEIAEDSFLSEDGTPYHGQVKARVGFTDPRNLSDILMAPGDFSTLNENGEEQILMSYGMFKLNFEDSKGKRLDLAKPIKVFLDPEQINMTTGNGNTTAKLWWLNKKTGRWVPAGEMYPTDQNSDERRKRSNRRFFLAELSEAVPQDTEYNIDQPDVYNVVAVEAPMDALVTMVGKQAGSNQFYGYRQEAVSNQYTKRVCIPTYRDGEAFLLAEKDGEPLEPLQPNSSFPSAVQATVLTNNSIGNNIAVKSFSYKSVVTGSSGPIYKLWRKWQCVAHSVQRVKYAFKFRETNVLQPTFEMSTTRINDRINPHLWYGRQPYNEEAERCYIKVKVIGSRSVIMVKSSTKYLQGPNTVNVDYGYSAAITEATGTFAGAKNVSVVCLEYRCNGLLIDNSQYDNSQQQTLLAVVPLTSNCVFKVLDDALEVKQSLCEVLPTNSSDQEKSFCVPQGIEGRGVGLYSGPEGVVQSRCYEGNNDLTDPTKAKKAHGHALTFNCS